MPRHLLDAAPGARSVARTARALVLAGALAACSAGADGGAPSATTPLPAASSAAVSPGSALLAGRVVAGPVCPVERVPPTSACAPRPVSGATIAIEDQGGQVVERAVTDAQGHFEAALPVGLYWLVPQPVKGLIGTPAATEVTLGPDPGQPITIDYDTGIR